MAITVPRAETQLTLDVALDVVEAARQCADESRLIGFAGGIPLKLDGRIVGAIGVSGGSVEEDHDVAEAGVQAL